MSGRIITSFNLKHEMKDSEEKNNFQIIYEILSVNRKIITEDHKNIINDKIEGINSICAGLEKEEESFNDNIDKLTNHADRIDYTVSVACGILCGLIDSFIIGEFNFESAKAKSHHKINDFISSFAKMNGYKGDRLKGAIAYLEKQFPVAQDNVWKGIDIGVSTKNHHLADFAHHPTLLGLVSAIFVQFFDKGIFVNKNGKWELVLLSDDPKDVIKKCLPLIISGLILWLINIVESKYQNKIDEKIPKPLQNLIKLLASVPMVIPILKVVVNHVGHLVSDMGGSKNTAGGGMGIPGLFISIFHEISSLPDLKDTKLPGIVNDIYVKNKFDMRSEFAVINELGRQAIPVLIGEIFVRSFYFVRRLCHEVKERKSFKNVNWLKIIPFNNRTIARMMTIESGTFMAFDLADSAIRSAMKNGDLTNPLFWKDFILRVNFVGIGRFVISISTDFSMGIKQQSLIKEKMQSKSKKNMLQTAKLYYMQEGMWIEAIDTEKAITNLYLDAESSFLQFIDTIIMIEKSLDRIGEYIEGAESNNPGLKNNIIEVLEGS